jgi:hypothetical protein
MKAIQVALLGVVIVSSALWALEPAYALGGCGANRHRNGAGQCVYGGQNEGYCMKTHGHTAVHYANGRTVCR